MKEFNIQDNLLSGKLVTFSVLFHSTVLADLTTFLRAHQENKIKTHCHLASSVPRNLFLLHVWTGLPSRRNMMDFWLEGVLVRCMEVCVHFCDLGMGSFRPMTFLNSHSFEETVAINVKQFGRNRKLLILRISLGTSQWVPHFPLLFAYTGWDEKYSQHHPGTFSVRIYHITRSHLCGWELLSEQKFVWISAKPAFWGRDFQGKAHWPI